MDARIIHVAADESHRDALKVTHVAKVKNHRDMLEAAVRRQSASSASRKSKYLTG